MKAYIFLSLLLFSAASFANPASEGTKEIQVLMKLAEGARSGSRETVFDFMKKITAKEVSEHGRILGGSNGEAGLISFLKITYEPTDSSVSINVLVAKATRPGQTLSEADQKIFQDVTRSIEEGTEILPVAVSFKKGGLTYHGKSFRVLPGLLTEPELRKMLSLASELNPGTLKGL